MTAAEIRKLPIKLPINLDNTDNFQYAKAFFLREIAAQLAELNEKLDKDTITAAFHQYLGWGKPRR